MNGSILDLWRGALVMVLIVGGPFVVAALVVGLLASLIQAATQLQENVLAFAPKVVAVGLVVALAGNWLLDQLMRYSREAAEAIAQIGMQAGR